MLTRVLLTIISISSFIITSCTFSGPEMAKRYDLISHANDHQSSNLTPDSKGSKLTPDSKGSQLVPDTKGSRLTPDSKGSRLVPDTKGTVELRLVPDSKGTRLVPDTKGSKLTPDSKGSRLVPDTKGLKPQKLTFPPLNVKPVSGLIFPPLGLTAPPKGFTQSFRSIYGKVLLPAQALTSLLVKDSEFNIQNLSETPQNIVELFNKLTIYVNDQPLTSPVIFQDIQLTSQNLISARFYISDVTTSTDIILTLRYKEKPQSILLAAWIPQINYQVFNLDISSHSTAIALLHLFNKQMTKFDLLSQVDLIALEMEILQHLSSTSPQVLQNPLIQATVEKLSQSIQKKGVILTALTGIPTQDLLLPVQSQMPLNAIIELSNGKTIKNIQWQVEDPQIALADSDGTIHPIQAGETMITASIPDFPSLRQSFKVIISHPQELSLAPSIINLSHTGDTFNIIPSLKTNNQVSFKLSPQDIIWTTEHPQIIDVNQNGQVKALSSSGFSQVTAQLKHLPEIKGSTSVRLITHGFSSGESSSSTPPAPAPGGGIINQPPVISSVLADINPVSGLGYPTKIVCHATDADNILSNSSFSWSCDGGCGTFNRTDSNTVYWSAPLTSGGPYTIRVNVSDGINSPVQSTISITVQSSSSNISASGGYF